MTAEDELRRLERENASLRARITELEHKAVADADATAFLQSVLTTVPAFIARTDNELRMRYLNRYQPGITPDQVIGRSICDFVAPEHVENARRVLEHTRDTGEFGSYETDGAGAHGELASYVTYVAAVQEPDGGTGLCVVSLEVTAHKRREQALRESQALLHVALDATGVGLWMWDLESNEVVWDEAMERLHGRKAPPDLQQYIAQCVHPHDRPGLRGRAARMLEIGRMESVPYRITRGDDDVRWVLSTGRVLKGDDGKVLKLMGGTLDITDHRALEEQLRQSQKMEAIGSLTAGIAHNFNNMLMVIMPVLELATGLVPDSRKPLLSEASHAAKRASELVRQLMTFAGQGWADELTAHPIGAIVDAAVGICRRAFDRRLTLHTVYDGTPATVVCNAGQIEQVLVNLLLNARDAVLAAGPGRSHVTVRVRSRGCTLPPLGAAGEPRACVCIEVVDDGVGMTDEVKAKAFEPFYTTKPVGHGTGLGLATSYTIVREHDGVIACESEPGRGSTFSVLLPLSDAAQSTTEPRAVAPLPKEVCVLIVDDDAAVRAAVSHLLIDAGMRVQNARSGAEALALLAERSAVHVVMLDRSMPDAPGESFVPRIRQLAPQARILFFSGQTIEPSLAAIADGVVHKPVQGEELLESIRRVVTAGEARSDG